MNITGPLWAVLLVMLGLFGCSREQPRVNPSGTWQGTLTASDGLAVLPFTAEIKGTKFEGSYWGFFDVGGTAFDATGTYGGSSGAGDNFTFNDPSEDVQPAMSPPIYAGTSWSGVMTETTYKGRWEFNSPSDDSAYSSGEFALERQP